MLTAAATPPRFATLVMLTAVSTLSLNMILPSLAAMAADFQVDYATVSVAVSGYLAVTAVLQVLIGPLSDRFGRRPVILTCLVIFTAASLVCMTATDVRVFLAFRLLQGVMIGGWAVALAIVRDTSPPSEAASRIGYIAMAMAVAPMLGPMAGGLLDAAFGWRAGFAAYALLGTLLFAVAWADLGETHTNRAATFRAQLRSYPDLLGSKLFWAYALCMASSISAFYTFLAGVPLVATEALGLSAAEAGVAMGSITGGFFCGSFASGRYSGRFGLSAMMIAGRSVACVGLTTGLVVVLAGEVSIWSVFGATVCVGIGNGLTMPSTNAGALSVKPGLAGSASGLLGAMTVGTGALSTSVMGAVLSAEHGPAQLLGAMLILSVVGLCAALVARRLSPAPAPG